MSCTICEHPQRPHIEAALHAGTSQRQIAQQFQVSKSTLGRHLQHVAWPAPAPAPAPSAPLTTAQAQEALTRLQERHRAALAQLDTAQAALPPAQEQYRLALWRETGVLAAQQARDAAQQAVDAAQDQVTLLAQGLSVAELTLRETRQYWQHKKQEHYRTVLTYLTDKYELWACHTLAWGTVTWHPDGRRPYPEERQALNQRLMARFPFVEGAAPLPPNPHAGGSDRLVWACRPLDYAGQDVVQGEVFPLQGLANDEALLRLDYCREVRPDDTVHVHNATGRRFIAAGWLQAFARTEPAPHEERMDG